MIYFLTLTKSITRQEVKGSNPVFFLIVYIFDPISCPRKNAGTVKKKVIGSKPLSDKTLNKIMNGIGRCIARINWRENLCTFARQYPKGRLSITIKKVR